YPFARDPRVSATVPAVIPVNPHVPRAWRHRSDFNDRRRWTNSDVDPCRGARRNRHKHRAQQHGSEHASHEPNGHHTPPTLALSIQTVGSPSWFSQLGLSTAKLYDFKTGASPALSYATCNSAMTIFFILSIASSTAFDFTGFGSPISRVKALGTTCHERPHRSFSHPHCDVSPPSERRSQNMSTSSWVSQLMKNETASLNLKCGPAFRAMNGCPSSSKFTVMTRPSTVFTFTTCEFLNTET